MYVSVFFYVNGVELVKQRYSSKGIQATTVCPPVLLSNLPLQAAPDDSAPLLPIYDSKKTLACMQLLSFVATYT
jgi:hypothetical protein